MTEVTVSSTCEIVAIIEVGVERDSSCDCDFFLFACFFEVELEETASKLETSEVDAEAGVEIDRAEEEEEDEVEAEAEHGLVFFFTFLAEEGFPFVCKGLSVRGDLSAFGVVFFVDCVLILMESKEVAGEMAEEGEETSCCGVTDDTSFGVLLVDNFLALFTPETEKEEGKAEAQDERGGDWTLEGVKDTICFFFVDDALFGVKIEEEEETEEKADETERGEEEDWALTFEGVSDAFLDFFFVDDVVFELTTTEAEGETEEAKPEEEEGD